jgi:hypothetical protein
MRLRTLLSVPCLVSLSLACSPSSGGSSFSETDSEPTTQASDSLEGDFLYHVVMLRAAPGRLPDLIDLLKEERDLFGDVNEPLPYWMRHTQGDQWDLMLFYPMASFHEYFEPERMARRLESGTLKGMSERQLKREADRLISWRDELFVRGPEPNILGPAFQENDFYHIEMFVALPGRHRDLLEERRMENAYRRGLNRPENMIFVREAGGPWDSFTLGFYRNLKHYAESDDIPANEQDRAARAAGFEGADRIGPTMRRLILYHRDTLCVSIR